METGFLFVKKKWEKNCRNDETKSENLVENRLEHPYGRKTPHWPSPTGATSEGQARHFAAEKQKKKEKAKRNDDNNNKKSRLTAAIYQRAGTDPLFSFSLILSFSLSLSVLISRHSFLAESHLVAQQPSDLFYFFVFFSAAAAAAAVGVENFDWRRQDATKKKCRQIDVRLPVKWRPIFRVSLSLSIRVLCDFLLFFFCFFFSFSFHRWRRHGRNGPRPPS